MTETTEAWVLTQGRRGQTEASELELMTVDLPEMKEHDVLAEPIYGCWDANVTHALERDPVDICRLRREKYVVPGNSGVVRILDKGSAVSLCSVGDLCLVVPIGSTDPFGHMIKVLGYDAPNVMGLLAKRVVWHESNVTPLPSQTQYAYQRWAGFPVRYATAWENWNLAYGIWRLQFGGEPPTTHAWAWGGGVGLAELQLARHHGCQTAMIASTDKRLEQIAALGFSPVDRRQFPDLDHDEARYQSDRSYKAKYLQSERTFLEIVQELTGGDGVSIFVENLGAPIFRPTLRALGRLGIVATSGWKGGKRITYDRAAACVGRQVLVHTHGSRRSEGVAAVDFAEEHGWLPPAGAEEYAWEDVPRLAKDYASGKIESYFPVFRVNPL